MTLPTENPLEDSIVKSRRESADETSPVSKGSNPSGLSLETVAAYASDRSRRAPAGTKTDAPRTMEAGYNSVCPLCSTGIKKNSSTISDGELPSRLLTPYFPTP